MKYKLTYRIFTVFLCFFLIFSYTALPVHATQEELLEEAEERKNEPVESNNVENWPQGPLIGAKAAVLMDANTGAILYSKNMDEALYPASITKLITCLIAVENCSLDEIITVNQSAIDANDSDGSHMSLKAGEQLTLEELLYGILINSANEACNVVAEHIAGSQDAFVEMMNDRAKELGCTNTHFVTTNGLHRDEHYTTAHDMALIGQAFFEHDILCKLSCLPEYHLEDNAYHEEHWLHSKNSLYEGRQYYYEPLIGSKTGFTSKSRQTLVSCAEQNGMKLICVILMEESPYQFEDTVNLFEYGFSNFAPTMLSNYSNPYEINHSDFFNTDNDLFGSTSPLISLNRDAKIILPVGVEYTETEYSLTYDDHSEDILARVDYSYHGMYLGSASITLTGNTMPEFTFDDHFETEEDAAGTTEGIPNSDARNQIFVNIYRVLIGIVVVGVVIVILLIIKNIIKNYHFEQKRVKDIQKRRNSGYQRRPVRRKPAKTMNRSIMNRSTINHSPKNRPTLSRPTMERSKLNYRKTRKTGFDQWKKTEQKKNAVKNPQKYVKRNDINFDDFNIK